MNEIEKMYENVGIEPTHYDACTLEDKYWKDGSMQNLYGTFDSYLSFECPYYGEGCYSTCEYAYDKDEYPPFTAEKQLEILCFIVNNKHSVTFHDQIFSGDKLTLEKIQENLAWAINRIWQDLTPEEKQQVKGILE